jgi:sialate O-acetylesterase
MKTFATIAALMFAAWPAHADVTMHGLFTHHMVLQRDIPVSVFGTAAPGENVTVSFAGQSRSVTAGKDGHWSVKLAAMKASTQPASMSIEGKNKITLNDIVIGDVWVCSGQSNMAMGLSGCDRPEDIQTAEIPLLRQFHSPGLVVNHQVTNTKGAWVVCSPQSAAGFTAAGFHFGRRLHQETGIPIGLIKVAWSATAIEPWISTAGLAAIPELAKDKELLDQKIAAYVDVLAGMPPKLDAYVAEARKAISGNTELPTPIDFPVYPIGGNGPGGWHCLYNGMIHPLVNFAIKGVIWYQGESNGSEGDSYFQKKRALIGGWRQAWNQGDFPFYFVQLASFGDPKQFMSPSGDTGWPKLRMAQNKTLTLPNTGMALAIDLADNSPGNRDPIHPKNKKEVGERLALWALAKDYGRKDLVYSGPLYKEMKIEGDKIRITFDHVGSGLTVATKKDYEPIVEEPQGKLQRFAIAGEDKKWVWANAVIDGETVLCSSPEVPKPVAVRYAFAQNPDGCNLYNHEGLPASPFRTDDW